MIWFFFIFGLALADKLDRTYLPPPGSKFSGGSPGAIDIPLEHPISHSSVNNEYINPEIAIGINRVAPKRPVIQDTYSSTINPSIYPGNTFTVPTTINPFPQNTGFSTENGYSTVSPGYYSSNFTVNFQNPDIAKNFYPNQFQQTSEFNKNQFSTENYSQSFQSNAAISDVNGSNFVNSLLNKSLPYSTNDGTVNDFTFQSSPSPQLVSDFIKTQYNPGQYFSSSIPTTDSNTNLESSTLSPSTVNDYRTTIGPNQFYLSTSKPPQFSTATPIGSKISPVFNYANIKRRPERIQAQADREATILNYESSISPEGYAYSYDTSNGIHGDESGVTVNGNKVKGSYSYIGDDGKLYSVVYTADENGFQPRGDHLPTSPPIPDAILKVIEQVTKEKEAGIIDDGSYDERKYGYKNYHNGFYSPKYDFSKVHSGVERDGTLIKNNKNILPNYKGAIRNEMTKNNLEPNTYQDIVKNKDRPVSNSYTNIGNNLDNFGTQFAQKPYDFYNKSVNKNVEPYGITDLETGDNANRSPSGLFKQEYINPIIENDRRELVDKQTSVDNVGKYNDLTKGLTQENKLTGDYKNDNSYTVSETETGYQYNPPQYTGKNEFPPRFSDILNKQKETLKQENPNKMVPKPFLTPYASETNDGQQKYDNNGRPIVDIESDYYDEEQIQNNQNYPSYFDRDINKDDRYNRTDLFNVKSGNDPISTKYQSEVTKFGDYDPQAVSQEYPYQQGVLDADKASYTPFGADRSYVSSTTTSTAAPSAFSSRINTSQSNDSKYSTGIPQTSSSPISIISSTTNIPNVYKTEVQLNKTVPNYSTIKPGFINKYDIPSGTKLGYPTDLKSTTPRIELSTNIPTIGNSYAPNLDLTRNDEYNVRQTTEKIIGEDFRGPKQPQRYDPITGYHY